MVELSITITQVTEQDYDGVNEDIKMLKADIDGVCIDEQYSIDATISDTVAKDNFKTALTDLGYTWDTEI